MFRWPIIREDKAEFGNTQHAPFTSPLLARRLVHRSLWAKVEASAKVGDPIPLFSISTNILSCVVQIRQTITVGGNST
jgi:hypothetical protein